MSGAFGGAFAGQTVLVTGHTGFKGAWLTLWLTHLGARVVGYALPPEPDALFTEAGLSARIEHHLGDVRDGAHLERVMADCPPAYVFHLAAQPLVRAAYQDPAGTFDVNVMGTVRVLEAIRRSPSVKAAVVVTTDKCYDNREWAYAYRENDPLGGHDPYSASKAACELAVASYRKSFFQDGPAVATARAGNVIGGGDWAADRIVPDCIRALMRDEPIVLRRPEAVRPWQHVLEPLAGYLWLAARLAVAPRFADAWNFGPVGGGHLRVREVVERAIAAWGAGSWQLHPEADAQPHEATLLKLDATKAVDQLGWTPIMGADAAIAETVRWYRERQNPAFDAHDFTLAQIRAYEAAAAHAAWSGQEVLI